MLRNRKDCSLLIGRSFPLLATLGNGEKLVPLVSLGVGGTSKLKVATIFSLYLSTRRRELFGTTSCRYVRGRAPEEGRSHRDRAGERWRECSTSRTWPIQRAGRQRRERSHCDRAGERWRECSQ
ncbi:hypothetical protein AVEN_261308-1 [Araneus ventricosus]|uniref:Uncharacterized protein n=1 Tax=Araneus ventricosus TaxID=182803 RepID=A0A4Y2J0D0_ARAVE|nr:hypothetical protein AVEN_261308-1 [Araneus ventricosus]